MPKERLNPHPTLALNTKVEEDFVSPLTAVRGALEILRDFPELTGEERGRFLATALRGCSHLERSVEQLATSVYAAGEQEHALASASLSLDETQPYAARIEILQESEIIEIDFSDFEFSSSKIVDDFYDAIDKVIKSTGRNWYVVVNYRNCSIWPEAWVAFAHRGKKMNVNRSLGTVRYASSQATGDKIDEDAKSESFDPNLFDSREAALAKVEELKSARTA